MRIEGKNNKGERWYIDSEQDISVKQCSNCGNPTAIFSIKQEGIKAIRFMRDDKVLAIFDLEEFSVKKDIVCHYCGNVESIKVGDH